MSEIRAALEIAAKAAIEEYWRPEGDGTAKDHSKRVILAFLRAAPAWRDVPGTIASIAWGPRDLADAIEQLEDKA